MLTQRRVFTCARPNPSAEVRLFCFPYAGGNPSTFWSWPERLPGVEVCALQLPGRGGRVMEPPFVSLDPLIQEATRGFVPYLDKPFAFFGHSMGALISFELARRLRAEGRPGPLKMFVSGCRAPQTPNRDPITYNLPEPEFVEELKRLKGTPPEVFESPELMQLVLPVLRADFGICQTYAYRREPPLACPIYAFGGLEDDEVGLDGVAAWREQTASSFSMRMFEGDHFFLHTAGQPLLRIVREELRELTASAA